MGKKMTFTADDVKRLKELAFKEIVKVEIDNVHLQALVARLEAAEALIEYTHDDEDCPKTFIAIPESERKPCHCGLDAAYEAWRTAAGK